MSTTAPLTDKRSTTEGKTDAFELARRWIEERPRLFGVARATGFVIGSLARMAFWALGVAVLVLFATVLTIAVGHYLFRGEQAPTDAFVNGALGVTSLTTLIGAAAGLFWGARRVFRSSPEGDTRQGAARRAVAQAVVARGIGAHVVGMEVGFASGGSVEWFPGARNAWSGADAAFDVLTVELATRPYWDRGVETIAEMAQRVVVLEASRAEPDVARLSVGGVIADARARAQSILERVDDAWLERIETELLRAGTMRRARFESLLDVVDRRPAGQALVAEPAR